MMRIAISAQCIRVASAVMLASLPMLAKSEAQFDAAAAFGARPSVTDLSLSPNGSSVAYIVPTAGQGSAIFIHNFAAGSPTATRPILTASGKPDRLGGCEWVSNERLICTVYGVVSNARYGILPFTRLIAINADGSNLQMLSTKSDFYTRGLQLGGGSVIDWLPDEDGAALMSRNYLPDERLGTRLGSSKKGLGVDWIDTRTLASRSREPPREDALEYLSDGRGAVRIMGIRSTLGASGPYVSADIKFLYRQKGSQDWQEFPDVVGEGHNGFLPVAVDRERNLAYGFKKIDGRRALYSVELDGSLKEQLIYSRPDVDVDGVIRIGRRARVVGVTYTDDFPHSVFFDPEIEKLLTSLGKALPSQPLLHVVDSSVEENQLLIMAGSDQDPGVYYLFDRPSRHLETFFVVRDELEGTKLATVKPVSYPAAMAR